MDYRTLSEYRDFWTERRKGFDCPWQLFKRKKSSNTDVWIRAQMNLFICNWKLVTMCNVQCLLVGHQTISHNMKCNACSDVSAASVWCFWYPSQVPQPTCSSKSKWVGEPDYCIHDNWTGLMMYDACDDEVLMLTEHTASRHDAEKQSNYRRCVCGISISESLMMPQLLFKAHTAHWWSFEWYK